MKNYIESAEVDILGLLEGTISFQPDLNFISGENGTFKTKLLQRLKQNPVTLHFPESVSDFTIQAVSPKRNAERKTFNDIYNLFRQKNTKLDSLLVARNINDQTFDNYPSLGDLFYVVYDDLCKDGGNQTEKMAETTRIFNKVIQKLFEHYELISRWDDKAGRPGIELLKNGKNKVPLEGLSLGEQEMLSLVVNIYTSRDRYDVFLIDEPEVHLNWHLEEKLFDYFFEFCREFEKQMIVVTHSRAVFKNKFFKKTQFLFWTDEGKVAWGNTLSKDQRRRIAGDAIEIIKMGDFFKATFFVEDGRHSQILNEISNKLDGEITTTECGNSNNVRSLYKLSRGDSGWENSYFLVDGDNEGNPFPGEPRFIHLEKYCLENYLLDFEVISEVTGKPIDEIKNIWG